MTLTRRSFLAGGLAASAGALLAACGGAASPTSAPAKPSEAASAATKPAAAVPQSGNPAATSVPQSGNPAPAAAATTAPAAAPTKPAPAAAAPAPAGGATEVKIWFHYGGATGEAAQKLIDQYNSTQGGQDKIKAVVETVSSNPNEYRTKMTASRMAGTAPD